MDSAYSLFLDRYDDGDKHGGEPGTPVIECASPPHLAKLKPIYRSFSYRSHISRWTGPVDGGMTNGDVAMKVPVWEGLRSCSLRCARAP
jgi:hypothetical protein